MDSKGKAAGKGLLIQDNMASTLAVSQDQYVFKEKSYGVPLNFRPENTKVYEETATTICNGTNPGHHQGVIVNENPFHPTALDKYNQQATEEVSPTLKTVNGGDDIHCVVVENHHADSRCNIDDSGTVQTLTSWMGTGDNNTPMVMFSKSARARSADDATTRKESRVTNTLNTFDLGEQRTNEIVTYGIGNGQTSQMTIDKEVSRTLDCMHDQKAIMTYSMQAIGEYKESDQGSSLKARDYKDATDLAIDCRNATEDTINGSLQYDSYKYLNSNNVCRQGHIVRRLTPLECCRLQGFPDGWAELKPYSDDDYQFWNSIHPGTPAQVQRWYDKLHTDSSEYKMWGNGIALPCALYVFEGIEEEIRLAHESPDVAND